MNPQIQQLLSQFAEQLKGFQSRLGSLSQEQRSSMFQSLSGLSQGLSGLQQRQPSSSMTINSQSLAPTQEIDLSGFNFQSALPGIQGALGGFLDTRTKQREQKFKEDELAFKQRETDFEQTMKDILEVKSSQGKMIEEEGIEDKRKELDELETQIEQRQQSLLKEIEAIRATPGLTTQQANVQVQEAQRRGNAELADLSIIHSGKTRSFNSAVQMIDRKIKLQLEPLQMKLEFQKYFLDKAESALSKSEKEFLKAEGERDSFLLDFLETEMKGIHKIGLEAIANGADMSVYQQIVASGSQAEALQLASPFMKGAQGKVSGGGAGTSQKPLSINQIEQFRRSFGWTPPLGFSMTQLEQFVADNPGATPEELEAGAKQIAGQLGLSQETEIEELELETGGTDLDRINRGISSARNEGFSKEEIKQFILNNFDEDTLFQLAKQQGFAKWYTGKKKDIDRMLNALI